VAKRLLVVLDAAVDGPAQAELVEKFGDLDRGGPGQRG